MAVLERFLAVVMVLLLVGSSSGPVGATSSCAGCADELNELIPHGVILDRGVPVYGTDGQPYAVLTNATQPDEWYSKGWVKHNDTVTVVHSPDLAPKGFVQVYIKQPAASSVAESEACMWPWRTPSGVPAIGAMVVVGYTTVTGGTESTVTSTDIFVLSNRALLDEGMTYDTHTDPTWYAAISWQLADSTTALTSVTTTALGDACRHLDQFPDRVQRDLQNENEYNNAKIKRRPTKNYNPNPYKKDDPNSGDAIVDHQPVPYHHKPYSCILAFEDEIGQEYRCNILIRYYDRQGNADIDIDLNHGDENGKATFPHKHIWLGYQRSEAITEGLEKVWD